MLKHIHQHISLRIVVMTAIIALALTTAVSSVGKTLWWPHDLGIELDNPSLISARGDVLAVVDQDYQRATIVRDGSVSAFFTTTGLGDNETYIYDIEVGGDERLYVHTVAMDENTSAIISEEIVRYNLDGTPDEVIYQDVVPGSEERMHVELFRPTELDGEIYVPAYRDEEMSVIRIGSDGSSSVLWSYPCDERPFVAVYAPFWDAVECTSFYGSRFEVFNTQINHMTLDAGTLVRDCDCDMVERPITEKDLVWINERLASDGLEPVEVGDYIAPKYRPFESYMLVEVQARPIGIEVIGYSDEIEGRYAAQIKGTPNCISVDADRATFYWCEAEAGSVMKYDFADDSTTTFGSIPYSIPLLLLNMARFLSFAALIFVGVYLVATFIRNRLAAGERVVEQRTVTIVIVAVALILTSSFFVSRYYNNSRQLLSNSVGSYAAFISSTSSDILGDSIETAAHLAEGPLDENVVGASRDALAKVQEYFDHVVDNNRLTVAPLFYRIYILNDEHMVCSIADSTDEAQLGAPAMPNYPLLPSIRQTLKGGMFEGEAKDNQGDFAYCLTPLYNSEGDVCAALEIGAYLSDFNTSQGTLAIELSMALLMIACTIYIALTESRKVYYSGRQALASLRKTRAILEKDVFGMCRAFANAIYAAANADSVILVLAAQDIVQSADPTLDKSALIGLPLVLFGVGQVLGALSFGPLSKKLDTRQLMRLGAAAEVLAKIGCTAALYTGQFWAFGTCKLLDGFAISLLATSLFAIPYRISDERKRLRCIRGCTGPEVVQSIIVVLISGYVAQYLGYHVVYALSAIFGLIILALAHPLPAGMLLKPPSGDRADDGAATIRSRTARSIAGIGSYLRFIFSPGMLVFILLAYLPSVVSKGYNGYLFPLYSSDVGFNASVISNMYVLARVGLYALTPITDRTGDKLGAWRSALASLFFTGLVFLGFAINDTFLWAVVCLFLTGVPWKIGSSMLYMLWPRHAQARGFAASQILPIIRALEGMGTILQRVLFGAFLSFGVGGACVAVGIYMLACTALYALLSSRTAMSKPLVEQPFEDDSSAAQGA